MLARRTALRLFSQSKPSQEMTGIILGGDVLGIMNNKEPKPVDTGKGNGNGHYSSPNHDDSSANKGYDSVNICDHCGNFYRVRNR